MVEYALANDRQALIFVNSRKSAESSAEKLGAVAEKYTDNDFAKSLATDAKDVLSTPTKQCRRLGDCLIKGCAFHHAGLVAKQRKLNRGFVQIETPESYLRNTDACNGCESSVIDCHN